MKLNKVKIMSITLITLVTLCITIWLIFGHSKKISEIDAELAKTMTYNLVQEKEERLQVNGRDFDYINFDAFFLRDLNGDGVAEGVRGTCKQIGKEDTLWMELRVLTNGYLENGKITINGDNFYFNSIIVADNEVKQNYIGNNIKEIELKPINNGTQKTLTGMVRSGDYSNEIRKTEAIGDNISNYSKINSITLTGTHVAEDGTETEIEKTVQFNVDWYGTVETEIPSNFITSNLNQTKDINEIVDEENQEINLQFDINVQETKNELILQKSYIEGTLPEFNGYKPTKVEVIGRNITFAYDENTMIFTAQKEATINEEGQIVTNAYDGINNNKRYNKYTLKVTYPIDAYDTIAQETIDYKIPVNAYYEGYNNTDKEFTNPYKSNIAQNIFAVTFKKLEGEVAIFEVKVGKFVSNPYNGYIVSKEKPLKIYNGISDEEKEDYYLVRWKGSTGSAEQGRNMVMKESSSNLVVSDEFIKQDTSTKSMEDISSFVGIYFSNQVNLLGEDGEIRVYDDETGELLEIFNKSNWNQYSESNPYEYKMPVKHIRVETSSTNANQSIYVYHVKEIKDVKLAQNYTKEEFDALQYIKATLTGYIGDTYINTDTDNARYVAPVSVAKVSINKSVLSVQETEKNFKITIETQVDENNNLTKWTNGAFLLKLPEDVIDVEINSVTVNNSKVKVSSYEQYEENGNYFIKINTETDIAGIYNIIVDCNITPDPRIVTKSESIKLYAHNENNANYIYKEEDIYDVNDNLNTQEMVNKSEVSLSLVSPNSLLTNQTATNYDNKGSMAIAPQTAIIAKDQRTSKVNIEINNNYSSTISEVKILGKIPFEGNTYVINQNVIGSSFTATMTEEGIALPKELEGIAKIYYSTNENPSKDLSNAENGWKTKEEITDFSKVKTYLIDLEEKILEKGENYTFSYQINLPEGLEYNQISYSHHAVYFSLNTEEGKYRTQTEPSRLGFRSAKQFDLEVIKYQKGISKVVPEATYALIEEGKEEAKTRVTNINGTLNLQKLYVDKIYTLKEIKTPVEYSLNEEEIKFKVTEEGEELKLELLYGTTKKAVIIKEEGKESKVQIQVEDEPKANIKLIKKEQGNGTLLNNIKFKLTGKGMPNSGRILITNNGITTVKGLEIGEKYTLKETLAEGYYLANPIEFVIDNNNGIFTANITEGTVKESFITTENEIPTLNIELEDEKIPTYELTIKKVEKGKEEKLLSGAKFKLIKNNEEVGSYVTDENGQITISNLYAYEETKKIDQTYTLKEVLAPIGYTKVRDISFKVTKQEDGSFLLENIEGKIANTQVEGNKITITIEDSPSFKLTKTDAKTGTLLPNTKFAIYDVSNEVQTPAKNSKGELVGTREVIDGKVYYVVTTDAKGEITEDLTEGLYKAVEVQASDDKYELAKEIYFGIGTSREAPMEERIQWGISFGGSSIDTITSVVETNDRGYIVGGYFSDIIEVGDDRLTSNGGYDGFVIKYSRSKEVEWATSFGGSGADEVTSIAKTSDGGCIVGGIFRNTIEVGDNTLTSNGNDNGFLIKYSNNGEVEWATSVGGILYDGINSVVETSDRGYVVGGYLQGTIEVGDYTLTSNGSGDGLIIKYSSSGEVEWATSFGGSDVDEVTSIAETSDGGCVVGGYFQGTIAVGDHTLTSNGSKNGFLIKYSSSGKVERATSVAGSDDNIIDSVTKTSDGGYAVGGYFYDTIEVGDYTLTSNGNVNGFLIKYDRSGEVEWATSFGGGTISSIAEISDGGYVVGGSFFGTIQVRDHTLTSNGGSDGFLIKYSSRGEVEKATSFGENGYDEITSVAETSDGGYAIGGYFNHTIEVGDDTLTSNGSQDGFLIKYKKEELPNIVTKQAISFGGSSNESINSVAETSDGGYIVGGYFQGIIQVGDDTLISNGNRDGFIIKYSSSGKVEWTRTFGGSSYDEITSVAETSDGGYIIGGSFQGSIQVGDYIVTSNGSSDGFVIKYSNSGKVEWVTSFGESRNDTITSVAETSDGSYVVGGWFYGTIQVGDHTLTSNGSYDGIIIKYNKNGEVEWTTSVGGSSSDYVESVAETSDGGYVIGGSFQGTIQVGDHTLISNGSDDGFLIKYNSSGKVEKATSFGGSNSEKITSIAQTSDGGYVIGGCLKNTIQVEDHTLTSNGSSDGFIIKYSSSGEVEWVTSYGGSSEDKINSVVETSDGSYVVGGYFKSSTIQAGSYTLTNNGTTSYSDAMLIKIVNEKGIPEQQEVLVENKIKTFKITTAIELTEGERGGSISGENKKPYETVEYDETSIKEIKMVPDEGYEISKITVNGEMIEFTVNEDGSYTLPQFTNMLEDKHIVVKFVKSANKMTIVKQDKDGNPLEGATFNIKQEKESTKLSQEVIKDIVANGATNTTNSINKENEITGVIGELESNDENYYFIETETGTYESNNAGINNAIAKSYMKIDLTDLEGKYAVIVNAQVSSEANYDVGYAYVTENVTAPTYSISNVEGRLMDISGYTGNVIAVNEYTSMVLEGGKTYYLHLGYKKDSSGNEGDDKLSINSVKVYEVTQTNITYHFDEMDGKYVSNNQGQANTTANSYIPIDLTGYSGKYEITVNAQVSSQSSADYGYIAINNNTTAPTHSNETGRFIHISGTDESAEEYSTIVEGGNFYFLHLGYYKDASIDRGEDCFTVNSVKIALSDDELYDRTFTTDAQGKIETSVPMATYTITEIEAPEGYKLAEPITYRMVAGEKNIITVIDQKEKGDVIVHHYRKGTLTRVAEDEIITGKIEEVYTTVPKTDIEKYELQKDENGEYIIPNNYKGTIQEETQEVIYYYEAKDIPITVHHYIEGTTTKVPLKDGSVAQDAIAKGKEGQIYQTGSVEQNLNPKYELVEMPENYEGILEYPEVIVTYYYRLKEVDIITRVEGEGGSVLGEGEKPYEKVEYLENSKKDIIATPDEDYRVSKITVNGEEIEFTVNEDGTVTLDKFVEMVEDKEVVVSFEKIPTNVIVHYYIEGTTNKVPSKDGKTVEDIEKVGAIGDIYVTKASENVAENYKLVAEPENASGLMTEETIVVIYYYKIIDAGITSNITKDGTDKITKEDAPVTYHISYTASVDRYTGNAKVTLIDTLPFEIDEENENINLNGGTYNKENNTITWEETIENIDTFTNEGAKEIKIKKEFTVVYKTIDTSKTSFENIAVGKIELDTTKQEEETEPANKVTQTEFTKEVTVRKTWDHTNNIYEIPTSVILQVKNGEIVVAEQEVTQTDNWTYTFTGLTKYNEQGEEIDYAVGEREVKEGDLKCYEASIDNSTKTIKNTYIGPIIHMTKSSETEYEKDYVVKGETITYTISVTNSGKVGKNVVIKDNIPEGTTFIEGSIKLDGQAATNTAEDLANGLVIYVKEAENEIATKVNLSFSVRVNENALESIKNIAFVDDIPTNETEDGYEKPVTKVESNVEKDGTEEIYSKEAKIYYELNYQAIVKNHVGIAEVTLTDVLPYPIIEKESNLQGGVYEENEDGTYTITWQQTISDINTYKANEDKTINLAKAISVKYDDEKINIREGKIVNKLQGKVELKETEETEVIETDIVETTFETVIKIPTKVVVHHYIYEPETNQYTNIEIAPKEEIEGIVGQEYKTTKSDEVPSNYTCINEKPEKQEGSMEEETIEVNYYYRLNNATIGNKITKQAEKEVLTKEDETIQYTIEYSATIKDYIGKVTLQVVDKLPAQIDTEKSKLDGGTYVKEENIIVWNQEIEVNTYIDGDYNNKIQKTIELVYKNQDVTKPLENEVKGTTIIYYPETDPIKPGEEQERVEDIAKSNVNQEYTVDVKVTKQWNDNNNKKNKRPESVAIILTVDGNVQNDIEENRILLSNENNWTHTYEKLPKYTNTGTEIVYSVIEEEVHTKDLQYYDEPTIEGKNNITITNNYKLTETALNANIEKEGTEEITTSKEKVLYNIQYNASVEKYMGDAFITVQDKLPYKIEVEKSNLDGGTYNEEEQTITWKQKVDNINTYENGNYNVSITKNIEVVYQELDYAKQTIVNKVIGTIELYETDQKNTVEDSFETEIKIKGTIITKYIDKETQNEIAKQKRQEDSVGKEYTTVKENINGYTYVESTKNVAGMIEEKTIEVIYYYERAKSGGVIAKYVDEEGKEIEKPETKKGKVGDKYKTERKEIESYEFVKVIGNEEGTMVEGTITVIYVYKKIPSGGVIVRYLEKETEKVLLEEKLEGKVGDEYQTERKAIEEYRKAEPEPENKNGVMEKEVIYVTYYYEKISSGNIKVKYVDKETNKEIPYSGEDKEKTTYGYTISGKVGDKYVTEEKEIPYYWYISELKPENQDGVLKEDNDTVIYYYKKMLFNMSVEKNIKKVTVNGENRKISDNKILKMEIIQSEISETQVKVTYRIKVRNTEEIEGTAKVIDKVPKGYTIAKETPDYWKETKEGYLETEVTLKPKEEKELEVVLEWKQSPDNFGEMKNIAQIQDMKNKANYEETNKEDNIDSSTIVMSIKTGAERQISGIIILFTIAIGSVILGYAYGQYRKSKNKVSKK